MAPITSFYGALAALLWVVLASNVILKRNRHQVGMGDGGNLHLARAVRVHANAVEYVPITLILMCCLNSSTAGRCSCTSAVSP